MPDTWDQANCAPPSFAAPRRNLACEGIDWLGYRDSGMAGTPDNQHPDCLVQAPLEQVTAQIVTSIRKHRPQVVICDNEFGGYGHPDHIKLHQATVQRVRRGRRSGVLP